MAGSVYFLLRDEENFDKYETILRNRRKEKKNGFLGKEENCFSFFFFFFWGYEKKFFLKNYLQRIIIVNRE